MKKKSALQGKLAFVDLMRRDSDLFISQIFAFNFSISVNFENLRRSFSVQVILISFLNVYFNFFHCKSNTCSL
jgi:hypothetical protein